MLYPNIIIQAGRSVIKTKEKKVLKANLGSCVGIAIWDDINEIGGIIHTLLPKPYSNFTDIPEKYASTGLPKFIDELIKLGANIKYLKAAVAGGGFPEPPDSLDLSINIGGETAEEAAAILKFYKIPIVKWETGGFFSCSLILNVETFEVSITPFIEPDYLETQFNVDEKILIDEKKLDEKTDSIKPVPQLVLKIIRMLNSNSSGMKEIAAEIKKDQVISAMSIKLCNSAAFNRLYSVNTVDEAILQLGEDNLVKYVLNYYLHELFSLAEKGYSLCRGALFHHAFATAVVSSKLAEFINREIPEQIYTAGLLHDLGKIVLDQSISDVKPFFYRSLIKGNEDIIDAENKLLGTNHCHAGFILAEKWNLPEPVKQAIRYHHSPDSADDEFKDLVLIVHIADMISSWFITGVLPETSRIEKSVNLLDKLSLSGPKIHEFIDWLPMRSLASLFPVQIFEGSDVKKSKQNGKGMLCH